MNVEDWAEIRGLHKAERFPRMPSTAIAERIGWQGGRTVLQERVALLRPLFLPPDPCQRTEYQPGEWDLWFPPANPSNAHGSSLADYASFAGPRTRSGRCSGAASPRH